MRNSLHRVLSLLAGLILFIQTGLAQGKLIWLEAEHFKDLGGWTIDWQFIDQMGSPYLLSIGYGNPVDPARTSLSVPSKGKYRLWVRTRDWACGHKAGAFSISVDSIDQGYLYGINESSEWGWEKGPVFDLDNEAQLEIIDHSGYYGRCDALLFSSDLDWVPPVDHATIACLRRRHGGVSSDIENRGRYDVVVVGGGLSGCLAAVSAARQGAKTILIQNRGELGGNASTEILVPPVGSMDTRMLPEERRYNPRESGLIEEVALPFGPQRYAQTNKNWPFVLKRLVESEPNLDLALYTHVTGVKMSNDSTIREVLAVEIPSGRRVSYRGSIFIDCTGNGTVGLSAGAHYMYGRESRTEFDENGAPAVGNSGVMPSSLKYWYEPTSDTVKFVRPSWAWKYEDCNQYIEPEKHLGFHEIDHQWIIELGGLDSIYVNAEKVRDNLLKLIYGIWDHQKNHCEMLKDVAYKYRLAWVGHVLGMRESYRLKGAYVMSENDVVNQPLLKDRIAYGAWGVDDHTSIGYIDNVRVNREVNHIGMGIFFSIPYRSLYSENINNLMMGGRNISVTHRALSAVRVMYTLAVIGQASGTAAGMCINHKCLPKDIYSDYLVDLQQQLLKDGAYIIELPNSDPRDLALKISSFKASSNQHEIKNVVNGYARFSASCLYPERKKTILNAWCPDTSVEEESWMELGWNSVKKMNVIHLSFLTSALSAKQIVIEALQKGAWREVVNVENTLPHRRLVIPIGEVSTEKIRIRLKNMAQGMGVCEVRIYEEPKHIIEQIERANNTMTLPQEQILYPWNNE